MIVVTASVCRPMWGRSRLAPSKSATDIDTHGAARVELIPTFLATCQANTRSSLEPQHTHRPHIAASFMELSAGSRYHQFTVNSRSYSYSYSGTMPLSTENIRYLFRHVYTGPRYLFGLITDRP